MQQLPEAIIGWSIVGAEGSLGPPDHCLSRFSSGAREAFFTSLEMMRDGSLQVPLEAINVSRSSYGRPLYWFLCSVSLFFGRFFRPFLFAIGLGLVAVIFGIVRKHRDIVQEYLWLGADV